MNNWQSDFLSTSTTNKSSMANLNPQLSQSNKKSSPIQTNQVITNNSKITSLPSPMSTRHQVYSSTATQSTPKSSSSNHQSLIINSNTNSQTNFHQEFNQSNSNSVFNYQILSNAIDQNSLSNTFIKPLSLPSSSNKNLVMQIIDLIKKLNIKLIAFDFDCTIVTIHTGGQWIDSPEKLAEFVRPCFRELLPALLQSPDLFVCVVTYSPQEQLIREVLRISMKDEYAVNDLINKIVIKGNTREFLQQHGIEYCFSNGKQIHLKYCRNFFETTINGSNSFLENIEENSNETSTSTSKMSKENQQIIDDSNILLIDDDIQNLKLAYDNGHLVFQVNNSMKLIDFYNYLKEKSALLV